MSAKKDAPAEGEKKKGGKGKKIVMITLAAGLLIGAGAGAGVYMGMGHGEAKAKEDPNRPKLVERSEEPAEAAGGEEGGEGKEPAPKIGTVAVKSDKVIVDPKRFEVTYFPIEQQFTANLADGSGFAQVGISLATYYDSRVINNIKRQMVPIRSAILMVMSVQEASVIATPEGRQLLQKQLTRAINDVLREKEGFGGIDNVYFTSLVVQ